MSVIPDRTAKSCGGFVVEHVDPACEMVVTDAHQGYASLARLGYQHLACAARGEPQVAEDYLPIVHLIFGNLKAWLTGVHHGVSPDHLQAYLNEFVFRFNRRYYPFNSFRSLLGLAVASESPTYGLARLPPPAPVADLRRGDDGEPRAVDADERVAGRHALTFAVAGDDGGDLGGLGRGLAHGATSAPGRS